VGILLHRLTMTPQQESGGQQPLHPHRAPGMDAACADAHLSSKTKAEAITETGCGVVIHTCCIHSPQELLCCGFVLCKQSRRSDTLCMWPAVDQKKGSHAGHDKTGVSKRERLADLCSTHATVQLCFPADAVIRA